ncbi:TRAP transporter substrate-binding protein [Pseudorhodoplanes sp.]|jgi:TRAP-type C4-dicarboxylate transport system substrate-binding protein|uniref:TRAP transporter substrate-binding protein n=1 Tax=Pseudorhodoplanes sp. TaxID=1934341 RepID=UPI002BAA0ECC|nr:TRAP transporter substrate-binding protein [Pseudorhodoplanes sp.]HWV42510.1 TRAP transporter substrate-binding protein [Pseudorhodoplanes sp.]
MGPNARRYGRRAFLTSAAAALAAPAVSRFARAQTPEVVLKLHHFLAPTSNAQVRFLAPWARRVEKESGGRIRIELYPNMHLGGVAAQLYDQARDGVADIVWTLPGLTPGRFPKIEVFELPFVANTSAVSNAQAVQAFYETQLRDEFKEVHPICVWAHDQGVIHTTKRVATLADMKGLKLRAPTRLAAEALKALGANGVTMPVMQVPDALSYKVIDGCMVPWEVVPAIKVGDYTKFHAEFAAAPVLYTATFILAMNRRRYDSLPGDLKKAIDRHSGQIAAQAAGKMWDDQAATVADAIKERGNTITQIDKAEAERWQKATQPVTDAWLKASKNIGGEKLLADAKALLAKYRGS